MYLLQDWTTIAGNGTTPFVQSNLDWADLARFTDAYFWLEVRAVQNPAGGNVTLAYESAPIREGAMFQPVASVTLAAAATPTISKVRLADNPTVPLARWLRWSLQGTAAGDWSVSFRIFITGGAALGQSFDPGTLNLTGWWRASYSASPWTPTASAGTSGSNGNLAEATNPPAVGSAVNGFTPASFDGTNDVLSNSNGGSAFITASAYSWGALIKPTSIAATGLTPATAFGGDAVYNDTGGWRGLYLGNTSKAFAYHWDTAGRAVELTVGTGAWAFVQCGYDGNNIIARVNSDSWSTATAGNVNAGYATATQLVGRNYVGGGVPFFNGELLEWFSAAILLNQSDFDGFKSYLNARYGLAL